MLSESIEPQLLVPGIPWVLLLLVFLFGTGFSTEDSTLSCLNHIRAVGLVLCHSMMVQREDTHPFLQGPSMYHPAQANFSPCT